MMAVDDISSVVCCFHDSTVGWFYYSLSRKSRVYAIPISLESYSSSTKIYSATLYSREIFS